MKCDARTENYDMIDMDGYLCLFTNMRLDRDTIPEGVYCYDVRDGDSCEGIFAQVQPFVLVNHWGTIITKDEIPMNEWGCYYPKDEEPIWGPSLSLKEFGDLSKGELQKLFSEYCSKFNNFAKNSYLSLDQKINSAAEKAAETKLHAEAPEKDIDR